MKTGCFICVLAVSVLLSFPVSGDDGWQVMCLEELSMRMTHPIGWFVQELGVGDDARATYVISNAWEEQESEVSIVLRGHTKSSIETFVERCMASNAEPESSGDTLCIPTLATYQERKQVLRNGGSESGAIVQNLGGRSYVIEEVHFEGLHLRMYSTFLGDLMIEVTFNRGLNPGPDPQRADAVLSQIVFEEECRNTSASSGH